MVRRLDKPLVLYRIADRRYPLFSGYAASQAGFRWNPKGIEAVYASLSYAGAMLEKLVHTGTGRVPGFQVAMTITAPPGTRVEEFDPDDHSGWRRYTVSQRIGRQWVERARSAILLVPSVVFDGQNAIINSRHPDISRFSVSKPHPVLWDKRLFADGPGS